MTENPKTKKNIPTYIGFRVLENTPSFIKWVDLFIFSVVWCLLKSSLALPININPKKTKPKPIKLKGNNMKLYCPSKEYNNIITRIL